MLQDVAITNPSVYRVILRYRNQNPTPIIGEVSVFPVGARGGAGAGGAQGAGKERGREIQDFRLIPTSRRGFIRKDFMKDAK